MVVQLFPVWAIVLSCIAYLFPSFFASFKSGIVPLLMVIMLSMGLTLRFEDFKKVFENRKAVMVGVILQFLIMPISAYGIANLFGFSLELIIGMLLVGSVAGGTASNVMCYLAKGDVALSVSMTAISTLIGVGLTPILVSAFIGQNVNVPTYAMFLSLVKIVLIPVAIGVAVNSFASQFVRKFERVLPFVSMFTIVFIIAIVVALSAEKLSAVAFTVALAVVLHNGIGLLLGYFVTFSLGFEPKVCRTIAFEVGLQNSGLASALAIKYFTPVSALPGSLFSIWHNISGSLLAGYWSRRENRLAIYRELEENR